jgi:hypothetical protein
LEGVVDPRTDDEHLWIRSTYGQAVVLRPILWGRVRGVHIEGASHGADEFRQRAGDLKNATPRQAWPDSPDPLTIPWLGLPPAMFGAPPICYPVVRSLRASACLSHWDADIHADGFEVTLAPLTDGGALLPVEGIVEATLYGYDRPSRGAIESWSQQARWSQPLTQACYTPDGGLLRLPLEPPFAEAQRLASPRRVLRLRLQAPGHGTFETEIEFLAMRRVR